MLVQIGLVNSPTLAFDLGSYVYFLPSFNDYGFTLLLINPIFQQFVVINN